MQTILGHKHIDTTLGYARLYDGTVAADYYQAMAVVERHFALPGDDLAAPPDPAQLLALVDSLREGTLNAAQAETVRVLRAGIVALVTRDKDVAPGDIRVPNPTPLTSERTEDMRYGNP